MDQEDKPTAPKKTAAELERDLIEARVEFGRVPDEGSYAEIERLERELMKARAFEAGRMEYEKRERAKAEAQKRKEAEAALKAHIERLNQPLASEQAVARHQELRKEIAALEESARAELRQREVLLRDLYILAGRAGAKVTSDSDWNQLVKLPSGEFHLVTYWQEHHVAHAFNPPKISTTVPGNITAPKWEHQFGPKEPEPELPHPGLPWISPDGVRHEDGGPRSLGLALAPIELETVTHA